MPNKYVNTHTGQEIDEAVDSVQAKTAGGTRLYKHVITDTSDHRLIVYSTQSAAYTSLTDVHSSTTKISLFWQSANQQNVFSCVMGSTASGGTGLYIVYQPSSGSSGTLSMQTFGTFNTDTVTEL